MAPEAILADTVITFEQKENEPTVYRGFNSLDTMLTDATDRIDYGGVSFVEVDIDDGSVSKVKYAYVTVRRPRIDSVHLCSVIVPTYCLDAEVLRANPISNWKDLKMDIGSDTEASFSLFRTSDLSCLVQIEIEYELK